MKITKKINFSSMWIKVSTINKEFVRLKITPYAVDLEMRGSDGTTKAVYEFIKTEFKHRDTSLNYGDIMDIIEKNTIKEFSIKE